MQTNPEQWAVEVREVETVTGDFGTEPGTPFYRIEIGGYCADFDYRSAAQNFANAIQAAFAEREARLVGAITSSNAMACTPDGDGSHKITLHYPDTATAMAAFVQLSDVSDDAALKDKTNG